VGDDAKIPSLPASTKVVLTMCEPLLDLVTLCLDNQYSSLDLYRRLTERKSNVIGTVRPQDITTTKLKHGGHEMWSANNICVSNGRIANMFIFFLRIIRQLI
jgi:hypothetical protein